MMRKICILFVLSVWAMVFGLDVLALDRITQHLDMEDGLSSNYVVGVTQDRKGYIWIATESGLNRFDGNRFTIYTKENSDLPCNELASVLADPFDDKIWIVTLFNELCYFDYDTETIVRCPQLKKDITGMSIATDGGIWITHLKAGVEHYDSQTKKRTCYTPQNVTGLKGTHIVATDDGNGKLYIGHHQQGLSVVSLEKHTVVNYMHNPDDSCSIPDNEVYAICVDRNKNVWIGTNGGLSLFNPQTGKFITFRHKENDKTSLLSNRVVDIKQMKDGSLWICASMGGVSVLDLSENTFIAPENVRFFNISAIDGNNNLSSPNAKSVTQDLFGNIWIGNYRGGIDFIGNTPPMFGVLPYTFERQGKDGYKQVWGLWADTNNRIWMGGDGELGVYEDNGNVENIILSDRINHLTHIYEDSRKRLWLGTYNSGILLYTPSDKKVVYVGNEEDKQLNVSCFYEDGDGKIWIATQTGIYSYENYCLKPEKELSDQLSIGLIYGVLKDKKGKLWMGTGRGIVVVDHTKPVCKLDVSKGLPSGKVNDMLLDSKGRVWVATRDGLILFPDTDTPESFKVFGGKENLNNTLVRAIQEDRDGYIWISTNGGISCLDEKIGKFYNYTHRDGVPIGDFMDGSSSLSPKGNLYFGSQNGVCFFNPKRVLLTKEVAPVVISQFQVYDKRTTNRDIMHSVPCMTGKVELPYNQNTFKLLFNVLDYAQSPYVEFAYMLEGMDEIWYDTEGERQITFRNIPPGEYIFRVKARFRNQEWNENIAQLRIDITPPLWLTWYAKTFYWLVAVGIVVLFTYLYKRKLNLENSLKIEGLRILDEQNLNNERLRFYTNITHELRTPLTLIVGPLEDLANDTTLSPKHADIIGVIHNSSIRLLNLVNGLLEFRKTETRNRKLSVSKGNLARLVEEIGLRYKELNSNKNVNYLLHIEDEKANCFFDTDMLTTILDNLMSNAAKYTVEGSITLSYKIVEENRIQYVEIGVCDTGYGIEPEALPHIFDRYYQAKSKWQVAGTGIGLALVKELVNLHEGILSVESVLGKGTNFTLRLLANNTYPNAVHEQEDIEGELVEQVEMAAVASESLPIVLVVEDNTEIGEYIKKAFEDIYKVVIVGNGEEGWKAALEHIPNIIVSDIMMPVMDGIELCKRIKEDIRTSHIPVILLTAKDSLYDKEEGYNSGADSYLTKPFSSNLLHSRIQNLLDARKKMMATLLATNKPQEEEDVVSSLGRLDNEFLGKITSIIEENLDEGKMDIAFIAEKVCMSHSTLYRKIKGLTGMSANEFVKKIKIKNGAKLLKQKEYTISEIAYMTGFSSVAYFRQCFKEEYGMSPSDYIKQNL